MCSYKVPRMYVHSYHIYAIASKRQHHPITEESGRWVVCGQHIHSLQYLLREILSLS